MYSTGMALAWEFWGRNRWGMAAFATYVLICAIITAAVPLPNPERFASLASMWSVMGLCYLIVVFTHGSEVRVDTADSGFPTRTFVLPVRTSVLVGWPMLQGALAAVLAWVLWDRLVLGPCGIETPFWWTPMLAGIVVTTQAVLWVPFGLPWVRVPVAVAALTGLVRAPYFLALAGDRFADPATENLVLSLVAAAVIPVAFLFARAGVARARRGDSPDWLRVFRSAGRAGEPWRERPLFSTPMRAQVWYEWRLRGVGFPRLVLFTIAFLMACGLLLGDADRRVGFGMTFLVIPVLLAGFCGSYLGRRATPSGRCSACRRSRRRGPDQFRNRGREALGGGAGGDDQLGRGRRADGWLAGLQRRRPGVAAVVGTGCRELRAGRAVGLAILAAVGPAVLVWRLLIGDLWVGLTGGPGSATRRRS